MNADDIDAQQRIEAKWTSIEAVDYWGILGCKDGASDAELKDAYFELARLWHHDNFVGRNLGTTATTLDDVFSSIAEAYEVLTDPKKRGDWEAGLAMQAAGMSTDVGALLDAESSFARARTLLERGEMKAAAKLFAQAHEVNPTNADWRAHHLYAAWWVERNPKEAAASAVELKKIYQEYEHLVDACYFAGRLFLESGDLVAARKAMRRVLAREKNHTMANRDLRLLEKKEADAAKRQGFFAKLFGRK